MQRETRELSRPVSAFGRPTPSNLRPSTVVGSEMKPKSPPAQPRPSATPVWISDFGAAMPALISRRCAPNIKGITPPAPPPPPPPPPAPPPAAPPPAAPPAAPATAPPTEPATAAATEVATAATTTVLTVATDSAVAMAAASAAEDATMGSRAVSMIMSPSSGCTN